jgi:hypothetical protein
LHLGGKSGVFGKKTVAGMDGIHAQLAAYLQDSIHFQIGISRSGAAYAHGLIGILHVQGLAVGFAVDGDSLNAHFPGRTHHA